MKCIYCDGKIEKGRVKLGLDLCFECASQTVKKKLTEKVNLNRVSNLKGVEYEEDDAIAIDSTKGKD